MIFVLEEIMHAQSKIFQTELAKIFAGDHERIKIVFFQVSAKLAALYLVLTPEKSCHEKERRHDDRSNDVGAKLALERFDHTTNIFPVALATGLRPRPVRNAVSMKNGSQSRGYNVLLAPRLTDQRFPAKLEMLIFSNVTSAGRESAYATALATSPGEIILWRGHFPSVCVQMFVSVEAGRKLVTWFFRSRPPSCP